MGLAAAALFVLAAWAFYGRASDHLRVPVEEELIWGNPAVVQADPGSILLGRWQGGDYRQQVRPLATALRAIEYRIHLFRRGGFQTDQILLHGIVAALVFALLHAWLGSLPTGFLGGLLFLFHPAASHSVLMLGGMSEMLSLGLLLAALLAMPREARSSPARGGLLAAAALAGLSMLAKEIAFVLPLVAVALVISAPADPGKRRQQITPVLVATLAALAWRIAALLATPEPMRRVPAVDPTTALPIFPLLAQAMAGLLVEVSVVAVPLKLTHDYSWLLAVHGAGLALLALGAVVVVAGAVWVVLRRGTPGPVRAFAVLAVAPLAAAALLAGPSGSVASERNLYVALPGWIGLALWGATRLTQKRRDLRPVLLGVAVGLVVAFALRTNARIPAFESQEALVAAGLASHPNNPQLIFELGNQKLTNRDYEGAVAEYEKAIALRRPDFPMASLNQAVARINQDELGLALRILDPVAVRSMHVRSLRMIDARAQYHAGLILQRQERTREAAEAFERTLLFYPNHQGARGNLGLIYVRAPHYVERGLALLRGVLAEETDPDRRILLQKTASRAEGLLRDYVDEHGDLPSKLEPPEEGAIGEPWKVAAAAGM